MVINIEKIGMFVSLYSARNELIKTISYAWMHCKDIADIAENMQCFKTIIIKFLLYLEQISSLSYNKVTSRKMKKYA